MLIPHTVLSCIDALEDAGFAAFLVGGCVRDAYLGLSPHDFDLCTSALPEQTEAVFAGRKLVLAGKKHGTIGVVTDSGVVEITTFRTEGGYTDSRHPQWVKFVPRIEDDLARRDFTVNAMAYSPTRGFADPFGGRQDLDNHLLRAVGDPKTRFEEDALRILRGVRFAAKFDLLPEENTKAAMLSLAPALEKIARERVFEELCRLVMLTDANMLCRLAPIITRAVPQLAPMVGFDQHSPHHSYDVFTHTAWVLQRVDDDLALKLAALFHDCAKPSTFTMDTLGRGHFNNHAKLGAKMADQILLELKAPTALREEVVWLAENHMNYFQPSRKSIRRMLSRHGKEPLFKLLSLHRADLMGKDAEDISEGLNRLALIREMICQIEEEEGRFTLRNLAVNGQDLLQAGLAPGPVMGRILANLLELVLSEQLPNEKESILAYARENLFPAGQKNE